jgi:excinuclease UvrABC nuclease subunit
MKNTAYQIYSLPLPFGVHGCYMLMLGGEVRYVGKSKNVFHRLATHYTNWKRAKQGKRTYYGQTAAAMIAFDAVKIVPCAEKDMDRTELALIEKYKPRWNVAHNPRFVPLPKVPLSELPGLAKMIERSLMERGAAPVEPPVWTGVRKIRGLRDAA